MPCPHLPGLGDMTRPPAPRAPPRGRRARADRRRL